MDDPISRWAAIDMVCEHGTELERRGITVLSVSNYKQVTVDLLESLPTVYKKGEWIDNETSYADGVVQTCDCSRCGRRSARPLGDFCKWCGAFMR